MADPIVEQVLENQQLDTPQIHQMSVSQAVDHALCLGDRLFRAFCIRMQASQKLNQDYDDIRHDFALYLLEAQARPLYNFAGLCQFETYITAIFRFWLYKRLRSINNRGEKQVNIKRLNFMADSRGQIPERFIALQEKAILDEALTQCIESLGDSAKELLSAMMHYKQRIRHYAKQRKMPENRVYYFFYRILKFLKSCLDKKGITGSQIAEVLDEQ